MWQMLAISTSNATRALIARSFAFMQLTPIAKIVVVVCDPCWFRGVQLLKLSGGVRSQGYC